MSNKEIVLKEFSRVTQKKRQLLTQSWLDTNIEAVPVLTIKKIHVFYTMSTKASSESKFRHKYKLNSV